MGLPLGALFCCSVLYFDSYMMGMSGKGGNGLPSRRGLGEKRDWVWGSFGWKSGGQRKRKEKTMLVVMTQPA